jgi:AraC-like DNA-binding protein
MGSVDPLRIKRKPAGARSTPSLALTRAGGLQPLTQFLTELGAPVHRMLRTAQLSPDFLDEPEALIPLHLVYRFIEAAATSQGIDDLGVIVAKRTSAFDLSVLGPALRRTTTIYDYLQTGCRLIGSVTSGERFWLTLEQDKVRFHHLPPGHPCPGRCHQDVFTVAVTLRMLRTFVGDEWSPDEIDLSTTDRRMLGDGSIFGDADLHLGQAHSSFTMPFALLQQSLPSRAGPTWPKSNGPVVGPPMPERFLESVETLVATLLGANDLHIDTVAEAAGLSRRTLQRRLREYQLSYSDIVHRVRMGLASDWLVRTSMPVSEIAVALGYTDPANFSRAFRHTTGIAPTEHRARHG